MSTILTAGIDIGTSAVKSAIVRSEAGGGRDRVGAVVLGKSVERIRRRDPRQVIEHCFAEALAQADAKAGDIAYVATTGEGELCEFRTGHFYGMTAHARGGAFLVPGAAAVLDVGALHCRAIVVDGGGRVQRYRMTSQCASGSGQFIENIGRYLGVALEEVGSLSLEADAPEKSSSICAVLAETDVINMVSRGISTPDILRGIHDSMAGRFARLIRSLKAEGVVFVSGGLAEDVGLLAALRRALDEDKKAKTGSITLVSNPLSICAGAIGAALWGAYRADRANLPGAAWTQTQAIPRHSSSSAPCEPAI